MTIIQTAVHHFLCVLLPQFFYLLTPPRVSVTYRWNFDIAHISDSSLSRPANMLPKPIFALLALIITMFATAVNSSFINLTRLFLPEFSTKVRGNHGSELCRSFDRHADMSIHRWIISHKYFTTLFSFVNCSRYSQIYSIVQKCGLWSAILRFNYASALLNMTSF